jgi:hypothetical protein
VNVQHFDLQLFFERLVRFRLWRLRNFALSQCVDLLIGLVGSAGAS